MRRVREILRLRFAANVPICQKNAFTDDPA